MVVRNVLPLATSLALHAGILAVGLATYKAIVPARVSSEVQVIIPTMFDSPANLIPEPPRARHETRNGELDWSTAAHDANEDWQKPMTLHSLESAGVMAHDGGNESSLVIGPSTSARTGIGPGGPSGNSDDSGFGPIRGAASDTHTIFPPISGVGAKRIIFVCDASGSMTGAFTPLKGEIQRYVLALRPNQSFNLIFFQAGNAASVDAHTLLTANPEAKRRAYTFLDGIAPRGETDPLPALELAFRQKPSLIYLLTDGDFPDNAAVLKLIRDKNTDRRTKINTIAFVTRGERYETVLKTIARDNGGVFRFVNDRDLGQ